MERRVRDERGERKGNWRKKGEGREKGEGSKKGKGNKRGVPERIAEQTYEPGEFFVHDIVWEINRPLLIKPFLISCSTYPWLYQA